MRLHFEEWLVPSWPAAPCPAHCVQVAGAMKDHVRLFPCQRWKFVPDKDRKSEV